MSSGNEPLTAVPTNIITGFLGVGKTSAILNLLKQKPEDERWAVLVNEFGEIGVDGSIFEGQQKKASGVYISEVPGGCMCCAAGLPMQVALNELLRQARPDRLLIEPTGLGHPKEVLDVLAEKHYRDVLDIQKTITLIDARKLKDKRYTNHETFNQQIAIADIVVGNKSDLYDANDRDNLIQYVNTKTEGASEISFCEYGQFHPDLLNGATTAYTAHAHDHHHHHSDDKPLASELKFPESGVIKAENAGEGYVSTGWRFSPKHVFDLGKVREFVVKTDCERLKAVFITSEGIFSYNKTVDGVHEMALDEYGESRIEIIADQEDPYWEPQLVACRANLGDK